MAVRPQLVDRFGIPFDGAAPNLDFFGGGGFLFTGQRPVDLVSGAIGTPSSGVSSSASPHGPNLEFSGTTSSVDFGALGFSVARSTLFAVVRLDAWAARWFLSARDSAGNVVGLTCGSGATQSFSVSAGGTGATSGLGSTAVSTGAWFVLAGTTLNGTAQRLYINGARITSTIGIGNFIPPTATDVMLGSRLGSTSYLDGGIALAGIIPTILSDSDIAEISGNLGLLFEAERIFVPVPAGGGTTYNESVSETLATAAETVSSALVVVSAVDETASTSDVVASAVVFASSVSESVFVSDATDWSASGSTYTLDVSESVTVSDAVSAALIAAASHSETASLADSPASQLDAQASVSETAGASDAASAAVVLAASVSESATPSDDASPAGSVYTVSVTEAVLGTDLADATGGSAVATTIRVDGMRLNPGTLMGRK